MKKLTVFTPTYNRAYCIHQCYESLKRQTCKDFIWLIIDDGSTDNTKGIIKGWIDENIIQIKYHWQDNQGMHGAHNTAYDLIDTELNVCIDSDDYMPDDAVEKIIDTWKKYGNNEVSGIIALDANHKNEIIGTRLPQHIKRSTLFDLYNKYGVTGDKKLVYRTELTKQYPYPLFENERYVGLAYKYHMIDKQYEMILMNEIICCVEYLEDGSSRNMLHQYRKNPRGFAFYRKEMMKLPFGSSSFKFRQAIHYVSSSLMSRNWYFLQETPSKRLTLLAIPLGIALYFYITKKTRIA
ncbi:glycosyltransferase family 2 protein [Priestia megaterium]|uniref:glycosyltransferase family 2 protein n=1 Tax=Priestia megaterium TaxID=1404 RepID=UPI0013E29966|nr:glycosyltransferase family 2 protein [Priestia megaterium]MED3866666.1 glycosyltransferase family 2 protein [Priestia megaterium]MED4098122.1 glycosyltransferase family 2 protein [Priestia megaterium]MED4141591.1 glycosyltransferase family 2 protein [Priestia megaterium]MED4169240.1 glycosyltransferase family 2 protein [Priestia megaterium]MED4198954.1 glycosyltransferase family 2 protein [Priestia megaterium]